MTEQITKEQISEYKEAFTFFDKDGDGVIDIHELPLLVRSLNKNPTEEELSQMKLEVDPECTQKVDFPDFLAMMAKRNIEVDPEEELNEAFKILCKDKNVIEAQTLRHLLSKGKEPFSEEEIEEMLKQLPQIPQSNGEIRIDDIMKLILCSMQN